MTDRWLTEVTAEGVVEASIDGIESGVHMREENANQRGIE